MESDMPQDTHILLAHGGGGAKTQELIEDVFSSYFANPLLAADDAAILPLHDQRLAFSTDGFIVQPWKFPGGNIGKLSICGTVNDLACMGARPLWLTCAFVLEEGFPVAALHEVAAAMKEAAEKACVAIVAGDTKVASKGQVDQIFITTSGVGQVLPNATLSGKNAKARDAILVSGDIGRHGASILLAREQFGIEATIQSDCAPLWHLVSHLLDKTKPHVIRDATRGGVGTVLYEIAAQSHKGMLIREESLPIDPAVRGLTSMLGLDPLYLACEGCLVIIAPEEEADTILDILHALPHGDKAARIGTVLEENQGAVLVETPLGAITRLPKPTGELLPRIC